MRTFLMVNPRYRGLISWRNSWLAMNTGNVETHKHASNETTMRNGDVYLWRGLDSRNWWGVEVAAVFFDDRCAQLPLTAEQEQLLQRLTTRVR